MLREERTAFSMSSVLKKMTRGQELMHDPGAVCDPKPVGQITVIQELVNAQETPSRSAGSSTNNPST
jgi:hypothetical protein